MNKDEKKYSLPLNVIKACQKVRAVKTQIPCGKSFEEMMKELDDERR